MNIKIINQGKDISRVIINDPKTYNSLSTKNLIDLIKVFKKLNKDKNIKVILAGMVAPTSYGLEYKSNFDQIYPDLSKQYNLQLIPFLLEGVALKPDLNLSDGMHPNEKGTIIISKILQEMILKNISSN